MNWNIYKYYIVLKKKKEMKRNDKDGKFELEILNAKIIFHDNVWRLKWIEKNYKSIQKKF